ncbi:MAG: adenosylcobinamide-GDP ribazoletransferase [Deinococcales bacterium]|nr:adenosylcobinamide-GDP ribazoletransferase [Chitinophagaceae bacterium]
MSLELTIFFTALMFLTRIPVPKNINHSSALLQKSARYFTWVGLLVGGIGCLVFFLSQQLFSTALCIAFSMLATILATGAFHEDGFADSCDAFGGGWAKENILTIMKDSRLGTYGVVGLIGILGFKFLLLQQLLTLINFSQFFSVMLAAHALSRLMAVAIMQQYQYVQDKDNSKSKPLANRKLTPAELIILVLGCLPPLLFLPPIFSLAILLMLIVMFFAGHYFFKWIGGYTGDCLGATQQVTELAFYAGIIIILKIL